MAGSQTHREKVDYFVAWAHRRGVGRFTAAPPLWRLVWRLGYDIPPPLFLGFWQLACLTGGFCAVGMAVGFGAMTSIVWAILAWQSASLTSQEGAASAAQYAQDFALGSFVMTVLGSPAMGATFGLFMAWLNARRARTLGLSRWRWREGEVVLEDTSSEPDD